MAFKAKKISKGLFEIHGIEDFIESKVKSLLGFFSKATGATHAATTSAAKPAKAPKATKAKAPKAASKSAAKAAAADGIVGKLVGALEAHPKKEGLIKAGKHKDQLLRSLIPLYVGRSLNAEISSGVTSKFWAHFGIKYAAPNAAKALREHVGYARRTKTGVAITPNGVKYVEEALSAKKAA